MPANTPITVAALLALVEPFGPAVLDGELVFTTDPPADLEPLLAVVHTGLRAFLSGRRWWAMAEAGHNGRFTRASMFEPNPADLLPPGTPLLCVEGDWCWDRVPHNAREDVPQLFARSTAPDRTDT